MNQLLFYLIKYFLLPLGIATIIYIVVHFQLLLLHKVLDLGLTHRKRTEINLIVFFSTFFIVLLLILAADYIKAKAGA